MYACKLPMCDRRKFSRGSRSLTAKTEVCSYQKYAPSDISGYKHITGSIYFQYEIHTSIFAELPSPLTSFPLIIKSPAVQCDGRLYTIVHAIHNRHGDVIVIASIDFVHAWQMNNFISR